MGLVSSAFSRFISVCIMTLLSITVLFAQDPEFSQFYANPVYTNPSFAGSSTVGRGVINYRSQWPSISGMFTTYSASYDEHYDFINGGLGFMITSDEAGVGLMKTLSFSGVYSYQVNLTKNLTMRAAVQAGYFQKTIDFGKLIFYDQIQKGSGITRQTQEVPPTQPVTFTNVSSGIVLYSKNFYGGVAVHNINEPSVAFYSATDQVSARLKVERRYTVHAGAMIPLIRTRDERKSSNLWPNILYMQQGPATQLNLGMYYNRGALVVGSYFRQNGTYNSDAIIFLVGFRLPKMRFGLSYDHTVSDASYGAKQSYEASLAFELRKRAHKKTFRNIRCPEF